MPPLFLKFVACAFVVGAQSVAACMAESVGRPVRQRDLKKTKSLLHHRTTTVTNARSIN